MNRTDSQPVSFSGGRVDANAALGVDRLPSFLPPGGGRAVLPRANTPTRILGEARSAQADRAYRVAKRLIDIATSLAVLLLASPLLLLIACLIWCEDRGPVLYSQLRMGRHGRLFRFYKFRSMVQNADALKARLQAQNEADGPIFKMRDDPRVTRIGRILRRYSLDELPQFFNVLRGEMSLVGPRPHLPSEIAEWADYPTERLSVTPGLVCLREVSGRSNMGFEEWIASDLEYIRRRSIGLDFRILCKLIPAVLRAEGAY